MELLPEEQVLDDETLTAAGGDDECSQDRPEAACEAASAYQREGLSNACRAARTRAQSLADRCEGARSPALQLPALPDPLTPREREVASLAARGLTSAVIAKQLSVSVRTVDNHLQQIYSKLDVHNRQQLAPVIAPVQDLPFLLLTPVRA